MGLLDDAIREHLDLKRRRGADPAEIERAEREALGPVRRNREASAPEQDEPVAEEAAAAPDEPEGIESAYDEPEGLGSGYDEPEGPGSPYDDSDEVGSAYDEPDDAVAGDLAEEEPTGQHDRAAADADAEPTGRAFVEDDEPFEGGDEPFADHEPPDTDEPATRVMRAADIPAPSDATAEYDVEAALEAESEAEEGEDEPERANQGEGGDEDMLEETPEFLQDTPDHDRLWFEQRPPRDFDFDG